MVNRQEPIKQSINSTNIADLLERILDKGIVIAGDIKIKLVEVELLTIQIQLVICSVEKAREIGLNWWDDNRNLSNRNGMTTVDKTLLESVKQLNRRIKVLETQIQDNADKKGDDNSE